MEFWDKMYLAFLHAWSHSNILPLKWFYGKIKDFSFDKSVKNFAKKEASKFKKF